MSTTERVTVQRVTRGEVETVEDVLVLEKDVQVEIDGEVVLRAVCSPERLHEWVVGALYSSGRIRGTEDIREFREGDRTYSIALTQSAPTKPLALTALRSGFTIGVDRLLAAARELTRRATLFEATGGTHAMALADRSKFLSLAEDVSRNSALEKAIGEAVLRGIPFEESFAVLSSRVSTHMLSKIARSGIPIVAAVSAPTLGAVELAERMRICLCGFVRGNRLNVYSQGWRIGL